MSKGGQGAAAANILLLKKSEESRRQETVLRDAIKVIFSSFNHSYLHSVILKDNCEHE